MVTEPLQDSAWGTTWGSSLDIDIIIIMRFRVRRDTGAWRGEKEEEERESSLQHCFLQREREREKHWKWSKFWLHHNNLPLWSYRTTPLNNVIFFVSLFFILVKMDEWSIFAGLFFLKDNSLPVHICYWNIHVFYRNRRNYCVIMTWTWTCYSMFNKL